MLRQWRALRTIAGGGVGGPVLLPSLSAFLLHIHTQTMYNGISVNWNPYFNEKLILM